MNAVQFSCPHCSGVFQVEASMSGQQVSCPHCRGMVALPAFGGAGPVPQNPAAFQQPSFPQHPASHSQPTRPAGHTQAPAPTTPAPSMLPPGVGPRPGSVGTAGSTPRPTPSTGGGSQAAPGAGGNRPLRPVPLSNTTAASSSSRPMTVPTGPRNSPADAARLPTGGAGAKPTAPSNVDALLPPGAGGARLPTGTSGSTSTPSKAPTQGRSATPLPIGTGAASGRGGQVAIPTEGGGVVTVRDPVKTAGYGDDEVELKKLTPEERARRRLKRNVILWGFGLFIMALTLILLLYMGPVG